MRCVLCKVAAFGSGMLLFRLRCPDDSERAASQICLHFRPGMGENRGVAVVETAGEQQSPGLLHLNGSHLALV